MWECPDFFELNGHHCLLYSTEDKVIWTTGDYDAKQHRYAPKRQGILDHGAYYAPKSFLAPDGRRILWGWIRETRPEKEFAAAGWSGAMALPRVLTVGSKGHLQINPAVEVEKLRGSVEQVKLKANEPYQIKLDGLRHELNLSIALSKGTSTVRLLTGGKKAWEITIDVSGNVVRCGEKEFPLPSLPWPRPNLRMFLDGSVIESFIGGREAITSRVYDLKVGDTQLEIAFTGKQSRMLSHWPLNTISTDRLTT
jgi:beta-fructofuranosidase